MRNLVVALCALAAAAPLAAQAPAPAATSANPPAALSLGDALALAKRNNPVHLETVNNLRSAGAEVRSAYGALLPSADASFTSQWQQAGTQFFNGSALGASADAVQSQYNLSLSYTLNASTLMQPKLAHANRDAVEADISGSEALLRNAITQDYLITLADQAKADLEDSLVANSQTQLDLANARNKVGAATILDVRSAEVTLGQTKVAALQAHNDAQVAKLRLFQDIGVAMPENVQLTTAFAITAPPYDLDQLQSIASHENPTLVALKSRENVSGVAYRQAQSLYTPTLSLQTGFSGYTFQYRNANFPVAVAQAGLLAEKQSCIDLQETRQAVGLPNTLAECQALTFTDSMANAIRAQNSQYPFNFTKAPRSLTATISIPLFNGFQREQRVDEAAANREDARYAVRAQELKLSADVSAAYFTLQTALQTEALQEQNAEKAKEELLFAEERYRVGAATYLDVSTARTAYETAENSRISAIYDYHKAFAALESAVGRPLR